MFKAIKKLFKKTPKSLIAILVVASIVAVPLAVKAGFGPGRPTYDWNKYNPNLSCTDPSQAFGRCGSMDGPVFNSFVNTDTYGDERNFGRIAEVVANQSPVEADFGETKQAQPGKEYWVRTFVHNNANQNTNDSGVGVARDVKVRVAIAPGTANGVDIMSYVSSSNAKQKLVWDSSTLVNDTKAFAVDYIPGSARVYNQAHQTGAPISDEIMSATGTPFGFDNMDGNLPGCFQYSAYVYVKVTVKAPTLEVTKTARVAGKNEWQDSISAKKTDKIQWKIMFANRGNDEAKDVTIRDTLPKGVTLVPGSIKWFDANHQNGEVQQDTALNSGGDNLGNYAPAGNAPEGNGNIQFETTINPDFKDCELKNVAYGHASNIPETSDDSKVTIENCNPVTPAYRCDSLTATSLGNRKFRYDLKYTAQHATLKTVSYDFGDTTSPLVTNNTSVNHTYAKDGNFTTRATLTFTVNGKDTTPAADAKCAVTVSAKTPPEHCVIPGKENLPKDSPLCKEVKHCVIPGKENLPVDSPECVIVNTGAGDIFGLFSATTVAGAAAHSVFSSRRSARGL